MAALDLPLVCFLVTDLEGPLLRESDEGTDFEVDLVLDLVVDLEVDLDLVEVDMVGGTTGRGGRTLRCETGCEDEQTSNRKRKETEKNAIGDGMNKWLWWK